MSIVRFDAKFAMRQLQRLQSDNARIIAALQPQTAFGEAIRFATADAHRYSTAITHVDTGSLRLSERMKVEELTGSVYLDPTVINPVTGQLPSEYGPAEHARGGAHAFFKRTVDERGAYIGRRAIATFMRRLP